MLPVRVRLWFGMGPPLGEWIDYQFYVENWRDEWVDRVSITDVNRETNQIKLKLNT